MKAMVASIMDMQEKPAGPGTNFGGFSCATGANQYHVFQMWMTAPLLIIMLPGLSALYMYLAMRLKSKGAVQQLRHRKTRRHSIGMDAVGEEKQIAQLYAMEAGKPVPEYTEDAPAQSAKSEEEAEESSEDDAYCTDANYQDGLRMQEGWGKHREVVDAEKLHRAQKFAELKEMEARAAAQAETEAADALEAAKAGTDATRQQLATDINALLVDRNTVLRDYTQRREALFRERPTEVKWVQKTSKRYDRAYWKHVDTHESTWMKPEEVLAAEAWEQRRDVIEAELERIRSMPATAAAASAAAAGEADDAHELSARSAPSSDEAGESAAQPPHPPARRADDGRGAARRPKGMLGDLQPRALDEEEDDAAADPLRAAPLPFERSPHTESLAPPEQHRVASPQGSSLPAAAVRLVLGGSAGVEPDVDDGSEAPPHTALEDPDRTVSCISEGDIDIELVDSPQTFNPGEFCEVSDGGPFVAGVVRCLVKDAAVGWEAMVVPKDNPAAEPAAFIYIRKPRGNILRDPNSVEAHDKMAAVDSVHRIGTIASVGADVWKGQMTWVQRLEAVVAHRKASERQAAANVAALAALREKLMHAVHTKTFAADAAKAVGLERELGTEERLHFDRVLPRRRWQFIRREVHASIAERRVKRMQCTSGKGGEEKSLQSLLLQGAKMHIYPGTGELHDKKTGSLAAIEFEQGGGLGVLKLSVTAESNTNKPLPPLEGMRVKTKKRQYEPVDIDYVEDGECFKEAVLTFQLPPLSLKQAVSVSMCSSKSWTKFAGTAEDEYSGRGRPDEGIYKCTVCNADVAVIACDLCGEEREPHLPWAERSPPFFQPTGTLAKADERKRQFGGVDTECKVNPLSGELMCEYCHRVIHSVDDKANNRFSHVMDRHSDACHPSMKGTRVLRKTVIKTDTPAYDMTTDVGKLRLDYERGKKPIEVYIVTLLVIVFLVYPRLMTEVATLMKCTDISDLNESFLAADYRVSCKTEKYKKWKILAQVFFVVYGAGIPLAGCVVCRCVPTRTRVRLRRSLRSC